MPRFRVTMVTDAAKMVEIDAEDEFEAGEQADNELFGNTGAADWKVDHKNAYVDDVEQLDNAGPQGED